MRTDADIIREAAWNADCLRGHQQTVPEGHQPDPCGTAWTPWHSDDCPRHRLLAIARQLEGRAAPPA